MAAAKLLLDHINKSFVEEDDTGMPMELQHQITFLCLLHFQSQTNMLVLATVVVLDCNVHLQI